MKVLSIVTALAAASSAAAFVPSSPIKKAPSLRMVATEGELYIDEERRFLMNLIVVGSTAVTVGAFGVPYVAFFFPPGSGSAGGFTPAKDALGHDIVAKTYLSEKPAGDRSLAQGSGSPATLLSRKTRPLRTMGFALPLPLVCTHLGCVVPWSAAANKFICPCHGSQYAPDGSVVRGPAPLPLALAHVDVDESGKVGFSPWTEEDFRTGGKGWWN